MTGSTASEPPRIFVSHSHADNVYCRDFVAALRQALGGADDVVWYDEHNLGWGNIRRTIERELGRRQHFIAILSPTAVESQWVNDEIDAALRLLQRGAMHTVSFVTAAKCDVPLLLENYKRIELAGGAGYPPAEAAARVLHFILPMPASAPPATPPTQVVMPGKPQPAAVTPTPAPVRAPAPARPILPRERFPERLERLGFAAVMGRDPRTGTEIVFIRPPLCPVAAGPFLMGSDPKQDSKARDDEQPQITADLPAYQIGTFPVTVAEYACFVAAAYQEPRKGYWGIDWQTQLKRPDHPVTSVTWKDARAYAAWLAGLTGQRWARPSEAEWEKAARWDARGNRGRGLARIYPWGDLFDANRCNTTESGIKTTTPVGSYGPETPSRDGSSPCGAQDMAGNVCEWMRTIYDVAAYRTRTFREDVNSTENRGLHGGSWAYDARTARAACRDVGNPDKVNGFRGFRVVLLA